MADDKPATHLLIAWREAREEFAAVRALGHRLVHGMAHTDSERVTPALLGELHRATPYAPDHLPREIELIAADASRVTVRVIPTNEELMIAHSVSRVLRLGADTTECEP